VVDAHSDKVIHGPDKEVANVRSMVFSPDGKLLALGVAAGRVELRDPATGKLNKSLTAQAATVDGLVFSRQHPWLVVLSRGDSSVRIWDFNKGQELTRLPKNGTPIAAAFSPDGRWLAVSYQSKNSGLVKMWDVTKLAGP
jgi:WD40 repeat protein